MKKKSLFAVLCSILLSFAVSAQNLLIQVKDATSGKWGYANVKGEMVIPAQFENCNPFSENGRAVVVKDKVTIIIDTKGKEIPAEVKNFELIQGIFGIAPKGFENGLLGIKANKKWGYLNAEGKIAIPLKYDYITEFNGGFAVAKIGTAFMILDTKGTETAVSVAGILELKHFSDGLAPFQAANKKLGFINTKGAIAIQPEYNSVGYFNGGYAWVKTADSKVGFLNTKGEWVIKPAFEGASDFDPVSKFARVKEAGAWLYIDAAGNKMYVKDTQVWGDFSEGLSKGEQDGKTGFYNTKGAWAIKPQFQGVREFKNGYAAAKLGDKWGLIDTAGNWVIKPTFDGIRDAELVN